MRIKSNAVTRWFSSLNLLALAVLYLPGSVQAQGIWTGNIDSDWSTGGNWDDGSVPDTTVDVIINGAGVPPFVVDPAGAYARRVVVGDALGAGVLGIQNHGFLEITNDLVISDPDGKNAGSVTLTGTGAFLNVKGALTINDSGNGTSYLTVEGGTTVAVNGATTIGDGTVFQFTGASGGALLGNGGVVVDGMLLFDQSSGGISISKSLSGSGIVKVSSGMGAVTLSGDNSAFSGTFDVVGGVLEAVSANALGGEQGSAALNLSGGLVSLHESARFSKLIGSGGVISLDGASLLLNQETNSTFAGDIGGVGGFTKSGSGSLTLSGVNSYDGGTLVNAGTLYVSGGDALVDSGDVAIASAGSLVVVDSETIDDIAVYGGTVTIEGLNTLTTSAFNMTDGVLGGGLIDAASYAFKSGEVSSNLVGTGGLTKSGEGTLILAGKNSFSGGTTVTEGNLIVTGVIGDVVVNGGTIGGIGTIGNTVVASDATVAPGNSIGTLNVAGDVILASGSIYEIELNSAGDSDLINASGTVILNGGKVNVVSLTGYAIGTPYHIIHADGGRSGVFDEVTGVADTLFLSPTLSYEANDIYLSIDQSKAFESVALTPNQIAAAEGVDGLGPGDTVWDAIAGLNDGADATAAFDALSGDLHASVQTVLLENSRFPREAAEDRLRMVFDGVGVDSAAQLEDQTSESSAMWGQLVGSWGQWDSDGNAATLDRSIGGLILGGDALVWNGFRFGMLGGYSRSDFSLDSHASSGTGDAYMLAAYGGGELGIFTVIGGVANSWYSFDTSRSVTFYDFTDRLGASYDATIQQAWCEAASSIEADAARFEPFANLAYVRLSTDDFTESGGAAALNVASNDADTTFTTFGLRAETVVSRGSTDVMLRGMVGWRHAFGDTPTSKMRFVSGGNDFTIAGVPLGQDSLMLDAGIGLTLTEDATLGFAYGGLFSPDAQDHSANISLNVRF